MAAIPAVVDSNGQILEEDGPSSSSLSSAAGFGVNRRASSVLTQSLSTADGTHQFDFLFKVVLIGDTCTGKTCTLLRFKENIFLSNSFISTVGIDYRNKIVDVSGKTVKLQIWDTAGQERFRSVTHSYYRDGQGILLLFDVSNERSFHNVRNWVNEIHEYGSPDIVVMLVGNKSDIVDQRKVDPQDAEKLSKELNFKYFETSAKTGYNIENVFLAMAEALVKQSKRLEEKAKQDAANAVTLSLLPTTTEYRSCCNS